MEYRRLGGSGPKVPALTLGTATFGSETQMSNTWGTSGVLEATRLIDVCLDHGLNMFDTADIYSKGQAEHILGIHIFPTTKDNVLGFEVDGVVGSGDLGSVIDKFNTFLKSHDKVRLPNRIKHIDGINPSVFFQSGLVSMKFAALQKVERYAIVGASGWAKAIIDKVSPAFGDMEVRTFPTDQEDAAWNWLDAKPA